MIYKSIQNFIKSNLVLNFKNELKNLSNNINLIFKNSDEKFY